MIFAGEIHCVTPNFGLGATLQDVRLKLAEEEAAEASRGSLPAHRVSMTAFLIAGLELEEEQ